MQVQEHDALTVPWKVDEAPEQPVAVIQDTEEGDGVCEVGWPGTRMDRASQQDLAIAKHIVDLHNASLKSRKGGGKGDGRTKSV